MFVRGHGYRIGDENAPYFITMTVVGWVDVFTRKKYRDIIIESLKYCQQNKGLELFAYVIMSNHIHMIARTPEKNITDFIRDFKKYTSKAIINAIDNTESRKNWMLNMFKYVGSKNKNNEQYQFWQNDTHPILMADNKMIKQRFDYIHNNPVDAGIVEFPEDYLYSSARNYAGKESVLSVIELPVYSL